MSVWWSRERERASEEGGIETEGGKGGTNGGGRLQEILPHFRLVEQRERGREGERERDGGREGEKEVLLTIKK